VIAKTRSQAEARRSQHLENNATPEEDALEGFLFVFSVYSVVRQTLPL
jgi:hypothetical protein